MKSTPARLYAEAFDADPLLADNPRFIHRSNAARAAALADCGLGEDAKNLTAAERMTWRSQAREWLRADLAAFSKALDRDPDMARGDVGRKLAKWRADPELAGLREQAQLANLSSAERKDCMAIWDKVDVLIGLCGRDH